MPRAARVGEVAPGPVVSSPGPVAPELDHAGLERLCRVTAAHTRVIEANAELRAAVRDAREAGDPCARIGVALDEGRRAARQRESS